MNQTLQYFFSLIVSMPVSGIRALTNPGVQYVCRIFCATGLVAVLTATSALAQEPQQEAGHAPLNETVVPAPLKLIEKPRWEFGLGSAALRVPAYPGSAVYSQRAFLLPWFFYRGDKVRLQDDGLKVIALQNQRVTIDLSISGSLNANSEDTPLRDGMPDIDYLFELGPKVDVSLWQHSPDDGRRSDLKWSTALRVAVSTDLSSVRSQGPVLGTKVRYRQQGFADDTVSFSASVNATWIGERLMDYVYEVDPAFVTDNRAAYDAKAGYLGSSLSLGISRDFTENVSGFIGMSVAFHGGAKNVDSPIFEKNSSNSIYGGISWTLMQSDATITVPDVD